MRRGSILGPLLLIAVGIVFFLVETGRLESHHLWDWYARWWPLLLVGAGLVMLGEWVYDQQVQSDPLHPAYRRRTGGGVVFLLLLLVGTGIAATGLNERNRDFVFHGLHLDQDNLEEFWGDKHESDQMIAQTLAAGSTVSIDNPRGDVTLSGTSDDNQIHIAIHKQVYTRSDSDADAKAQKLNPSLSTSSDRLTINVPALEGSRADLIVTMPPSSSVTVSANHGDVHVNSVKASVNITANHGDVEISAITGPVLSRVNNHDSSFSAHSITGPVTIEGRARDLTLSDISGPTLMNGEFFGTTHLEHIAGTVKFHTSRTDLQFARLDGEIEISPNADLTANQAVGPVTLTTRNRNINLERISGDLSVTNSNGSVELTSAPPLGNVNVVNRNGSISLTLPEQAGFTLHAETTNGDLDNEFSLPVSGDENHKSLSGSVGRGDSTIHLTTSQGDVSVKKASIAPLPPLPPPPPPITAIPPPGVNKALEDARRQVRQAEKQVEEAQKKADTEVRRATRRSDHSGDHDEDAPPPHGNAEPKQ